MKVGAYVRGIPGMVVRYLSLNPAVSETAAKGCVSLRPEPFPQTPFKQGRDCCVRLLGGHAVQAGFG